MVEAFHQCADIERGGGALGNKAAYQAEDIANPVIKFGDKKFLALLGRMAIRLSRTPTSAE